MGLQGFVQVGAGGERVEWGSQQRERQVADEGPLQIFILCQAGGWHECQRWQAVADRDRGRVGGGDVYVVVVWVREHGHQSGNA